MEWSRVEEEVDDFLLKIEDCCIVLYCVWLGWELCCYIVTLLLGLAGEVYDVIGDVM